MKVLKSDRNAVNNDYLFLLDGADVALLKEEPLIGEVYKYNYAPPSPAYRPYVLVDEKITLVVDSVRPVAGGGANANSPNFTEFWIRPRLYDVLKMHGSVTEIRYDINQGSKMDLINYDFKRNWNFHISTLIRDLDLNV